MAILGKIKERQSAMEAAKVSDPRQLVLTAPSFDHKGYVEGQMREKENQMAQPLQPTTSMGDVAFNNTEKPVLEKWDLDKMAESQRNNYMQSFGTWAEAEKRGDISQQAWANAKIQEMVAKGENPGDYINMLALMGDSETPEQKAKRERREQLGEVFNNLGNLIGNAANLYYATKGGIPIDLNSVNEKHRERMDRIKEKQDALAERQKEILMNARLGDIKAERAEKATEKKLAADKAAAQLKFKQDLYLKELDNAYKMGQIDAQTKAKLAQDAANAKTDKELESIKAKYNKDLEAFKQQNRLTLKATPSYGQDKVLTSLTGADGNVYTRNSKLDNVEMRELAKYIEDWSPYTTVDEDGKETIDYIGAIADAAESGLIPTEVLEQRGYKKGKSSGKKSIEGFGESNKSSNKKTISGF